VFKAAISTAVEPAPELLSVKSDMTSIPTTELPSLAALAVRRQNSRPSEPVTPTNLFYPRSGPMSSARNIALAREVHNRVIEQMDSIAPDPIPAAKLACTYE
jgi:hypothetical protein